MVIFALCRHFVAAAHCRTTNVQITWPTHPFIGVQEVAVCALLALNEILIGSAGETAE